MSTDTSYPAASIRAVWAVSFPMILALMSGCIMFFADRLIIAQYATDAMTAVAAAGIIVTMFQFGAISIVSIAEVFVGQSNGAGNRQDASKYIWAMIWLSLGFSIIYIPAAFQAEFFVADPYDGFGVPYFFWLMIFASLWPLHATFTSFFVGIAQTKFVTIAAVIANLINITLDFILIFGIEGWIPAMGTKGAAIATVIAMIFQNLILGSMYFHQKFNKDYQTRRISFDLDAFKSCIKTGLPMGAGHFIELSAWGFLIHLSAMTSKAHVTVVAIGQNAFVLFIFILEGLSKGSTALASNYIGQKNKDLIPKLIRSALSIHVGIAAILSIGLYLTADLLIEGFIDKDLGVELYHTVFEAARYTLIWVMIYFVLDGISWIIAGVLTSGGDTKVVMMINGIFVYLFAILPVYLLVKQDIFNLNLGPDAPWMIILMYAMIMAGAFAYRYKQNKWLKIDLSSPDSTQK